MDSISKHSRFNKSIDIKMQRPKGFLGGKFMGGSSGVFKVPPLNAVIESGYGIAPKVNNTRGFQSSTTTNIPFLNWASIKSNKFDDPNKYRLTPLKVYDILKPIAQDCCGACWAVSSSMAFADRYGIANDEMPIDPSIISVMSCCTKQMHKNVFAIVDTPDCDIMSSYSELGGSTNSMGMCSGGIPYSAGMSIYRNGLPNDKDTKYTSALFTCDSTPSFPNMNQSLIDAYPCDKKIFDTDNKIRMESKPVYISSSQGSPDHYVELMKKALLEGGPIVGGFMVLGDFLGLETDGSGLGSDGDKNKILNWDTTGKVYVPGAYDKLFPSVSISAVGGSTTIDVENVENGQSVVVDTGVKAKSTIGSIFSGFHAVVIVGWGEIDMSLVENKDVKSITGSDGNQKLPFWVCRNSWGSVWPVNGYYSKGVSVLFEGSPETMDIPGGYWLHAMYPNESMALDVPIHYEGTDYGSTMVMTASKDEKEEEIVSQPTTTANEWVDSEGYNCSQYSEFGWCKEDGGYGDGWKDSWGKFGDFENNNLDAVDTCKECNIEMGSSEELRLSQINNEKTIIWVIMFVSILLYSIFLIYISK